MIWMVRVPSGVVGCVVTVTMDSHVGSHAAGTKTHVVSVGRLEQAKVMGSGRPAIRVALALDVTDPPAMELARAGSTDKEKSNGGGSETMSANAASRLEFGPDPTIRREYVPGGVASDVDRNSADWHVG